MKKRGFILLLAFFLLITFSFSLVLAQDDTSSNTETTTEEPIPDETTTEEPTPYELPAEENAEELYKEAEEFEEELQQSAGITPDSKFYAIDKFFDRFASNLNVREEKIAEMKSLASSCEEGSQNACNSLEEAFNSYKEHADDFELEVSPEEQEEAERSSRAIRGTLVREIAQNIPPTLKDEYIKEIIEQEKDISTAAEIATKIKELCTLLSSEDPNLYYRTCKADEDEFTPDWKRKLDNDLTDQQKEEAKKFSRIMSQCFKTSGQDCQCEDIPFPEFAATCSIAAPLATACDIEDDEIACEQLDNLEMPELPPHLQDIFDNLEDTNQARFDLHLPKECQEAGATTPKECSKIMIQTHAPEECKEALLNANVQNEREGREICEKIMFELRAPPECKENGITDPEKCKDFMWGIGNRPPECQENQIHDFKDCQKFLETGGSNRGPGPSFNPDCSRIENPEERLSCYDSASKGAFEHYENNNFEERFKETKERERQCAESCNGAWSFYNGECSCRTENNEYREFQNRREFEPREGFTPPQNGFPPDFTPPEGFVPPEGFIPPQEQGSFEPPPESPSGSEGESSSGSSDSEGGDSGEGGGITGGVIFDNDFLRYFFK